MREIQIIDTGKVPYLDSYNLQLKILEDLNTNPEKIGTLIITEPTPTITKGIRGEDSDIYISKEEMSNKNIKLVEIRRGGMVTFHGPGQLVIYPILNLTYFKKSIKWYIETLEELVISTLQELGVEAYKKDGIVGIFTDKGKICAIGIEVKRWKTLHGIAINHEVDLNCFNNINPCGISDLGVTSISNEGINVTRDEILKLFISNFSEKFNVKTNNTYF